MEREIAFLKDNIPVNSSVVIACSGGPDSMCLLSLVTSLRKEQNINLICAHVNHKIRLESEKEAEMVQKYCQENKIIFEYFTIDEFQRGNFTEEKAREKRYEFFDSIVHKYQAKYLLTAHHGDDLIETILMRITRGSNLSGYIGIKQINSNSNYTILRPLLTTNKDNILKFIEVNNIPYAIDSSNNSLKYTRNRYRQKVLPFLKKEESNINLKYLKFSEELISYENFVNEYINKKKIIVDNKIVINKIIEEPDFIKRKSIEVLIKNIQTSSILEVSDKNMHDILKLINNNNKSINLKNGFIAKNSYGYLKIVKKSNEEFPQVVFDKNLTTNLFNFYFNCRDGNESNNCIYLLSSEIKLPLSLRTRNNGDRIVVKNLNGSQKINDIFITSKIPKEKRRIYPILVDSNDTILWVPGLKKSKFAKDKSEKYDIIIKCEAR